MKARRQTQRSLGVGHDCLGRDRLTTGSRPRQNRRGATLVETALTLGVLLSLVLGMLELGIAVFRQHVVTEAARQAARRAIIHGDLAKPNLGKWGPATWDGSAHFMNQQGGDDDDEVSPNSIAASIGPYMTGLDKNQTTIRMEWLDGSNELHSRVRCRVTTPHQPFVSFLFGTSSWNLTGTSTMQIAH